MKYRKKPVVIEAEQYTETNIPNGVFEEEFYTDPADIGGRRLVKWNYVITIHGQKTKVVYGDWIIPEPDGIHHYPCKPDIFEKTYSPVDETEPSDTGDQDEMWKDVWTEINKITRDEYGCAIMTNKKELFDCFKSKYHIIKITGR